MKKKEEKPGSRRIFRIMWRLFFVCLLVLVCYLLSTEGYAFGKALFTDSAVSGTQADVQVTVKEGQSLSSVAKQLEQKGLISDSFVFYSKAKLYKYSIYPGTYLLSPSMTDREILDQLSIPPDKE